MCRWARSLGPGLSTSTSAGRLFQSALLAMGFAATALAVARIGALVAKLVAEGQRRPDESRALK